MYLSTVSKNLQIYIFVAIYILDVLIAQSFSPFSARDGRQVCRPSWIWATSLCYILLNKFVALVGSGRRICRPSHDKKGLKDWANICNVDSLFNVFNIDPCFMSGPT
jgi:hypothetical protein